MKAELWQHPFVDVFKFVGLNEWKVSQKEGDVTECLDRVTGKRVYRIAGSISAGNYIQIPRPKSQLKTLGLTGRFIYLQVMQVPEKFFSVHLEFVLSNSKTKAEEPLRVSLSNLFKETKLTNAGMQIVCQLGLKWAVLVLDMKKLLDKFVGSHISAHVLRSLTICSTIFVKGVYTSDNLYENSNLPKEMSFKLARDTKWNDLYDWVTFFFEPSILKKSRKNEGTKSQCFEESLSENVEKGQEFRPMTSDVNEGRLDFDRNYLKTAQKKEEEFEIIDENLANLMNPDPLMHLSNVIGYSGSNPRALRFSKLHSDFSLYSSEFTEGSSKYLFYPSGCTLAIMNPVSKKQHFFFGHTAVINCLSISQDGSLVASGQASPALVLIREIKSLKAPTFVAFGKMVNLKSIDISCDNKYLVTAGTDIKARETLIVWDISGILLGKSPVIKAKQVCNFHVNTVKFSPIDSDRLMSCGKESIRSWRLKKDNLSGRAIVLSHHARSSEFLDLDYDIFTSTSKSPEVDSYLKRVFVVSDQGLLFQINYESAEIEGVLQLHDSAINSIVVTEGYCVTGSHDSYLRVWPLDFSEYLLEARHEGPVVAVDISMDRYTVACGTLNCTIGTLDMSTNAYKTLLRSHTDPIISIDVHPLTGMILTASHDKTLRIWSPDSFEEQFEFFSPQDLPLSVTFHPVLNFFACGFLSGSVRIFEIETTSMKEEFLQHETKIVKCLHSPNALMLLSVSSDGIICVYDTNKKYQPIRTIPSEAACEKIDVAFSQDSKLIGVAGSHKNFLFVWDSWKLVQLFKINISGFNAEKLSFSHDNHNLIVMGNGQDHKVKVYKLNENSASLIREFSAVHNSAQISEVALSQNSKYLVSGGADKIIKIWPYLAKTWQNISQSFIGHSFPINNLKFSIDGRFLISSADGPDGIFIWKFNGDISA